MTARAWVWGAFFFAAGCLEHQGAYLAHMDQTPPTVTSSDPVPLGGTTAAIPRNAVFTAVFSEEMDRRSLHGGIQLLNGPVRLDLEFTVPKDDGDDIDTGDVPYTVKFTLPGAQPLEPNATYVLVYSTILTDTEGNPLAAEVRNTFTTGP